MRKYDFKNKRNIGVIIGISVIIIVMFSLVISFFLGIDKKEYEVLAGTLVFDKDKTIIKVGSGGIIKTKWNNDYYLIYNDENYELGNTAIAYNENSGAIYLYGRYYEINNGDEIKVTSDETVIKNSALTKFYKLADRKYLVVDTEIKSSDGLLSTSDFLMVDLDKVGNATLTNHKVNLKTFSETTIVTSNYTFDIANEILIYGSDKIDLKKIIGSTNTYTKEDLEPEEDIVGGNSDDVTHITDNTGGTGTGTGTGEGNGSGGGGGSDGTGDGSGTGSGGGGGSDGDGTGSGSGGGGSDGTGDGSGEGEGDGTGSGSGGGSGSGDDSVLEEIKKASKNTSIVSVNAGINKISVDYVIYDPYNEYISVYMEVLKEGSSESETYYLKSTDTNYTISKNIIPNTKYQILFKCSYIDPETKEEVFDTIDDISITTKLPSVSIKVTNIDFDNITYLISTDNNFNISGALLTLYINDVKYKDYDLVFDKDYESFIEIPEIDSSVDDDKEIIMELRLTNIKFGDTVIEGLSARTKFKY